MANVEFKDYSATVKADLEGNALQFITVAAFELQAETQRKTPTTETQLKGSWEKEVDPDTLTATVGSPLENALWNEFGTGSYAENGNGRKGWWVYVEGNPKSSKVSKTYASEAEANETVAFLRSKGLPAFASQGKPKQKTLYNAFQNKKSAIIRRAQQIFGGGDNA